MAGDSRDRMVVVVEDAEAARTALEWAIQNIIRSGDMITLLYVFQSSETGSGSSGQKNKQNSNITKTSRRLLRLKGFHLALSFKDLCDRVPEARVEIVVTEGDEGPTIVSLVKKIGASVLILGLRSQSFLWRYAVVLTGLEYEFRRFLGRKDISDYCIKNLDCRVLAVKPNKSSRTALPLPQHGRMASEIQSYNTVSVVSI